MPNNVLPLVQLTFHFGKPAACAEMKNPPKLNKHQSPTAPTAPTAPCRTHSPTATHTRMPRCAVMVPAIDVHENRSIPNDVRVADYLQVVGKKLNRAEEGASLICEALNLV
eukprot:2964824-Pleurochrysis_carterae.AAC.1